MMTKRGPITLFLSYAHEDEPLRKQLEKHLRLLQRQGLLSTWHDRQITPGANWSQEIDEQLEQASIILLLVSPDFMASEYCYDIEMQRALALQQAGKAIVIPLLLRPVDWEHSPFAHLQCLSYNGPPVTKWDDADEAFATITTELRGLIENRHSPADAAVSSPHSGTSTRLSSASKDPNRRRMLDRMRRTWITGILEHSLSGEVHIELGLEHFPTALENPWRLLIQETDLPAYPLLEGTSITQVYDEAEGALLILGEPGAGKTTLLLELARTLLVRAQTDEQEPIPAVFNLSSWATKNVALTDWLIEELHDKYQVPRSVGTAWVKQDQLLLLLDSLDEVAPVARSACIEAINLYREAHPLVPLVVCSRRVEYLDQIARLRLHTAVMIQPLSPEQIEQTFAEAGEQIAGLREALRQDVDLETLASTPLMLSILILVYKESSLREVVAQNSVEDKRQQIFSFYVQHMLRRRRASTRYTHRQTVHWLTWLAQRMVQHNQTVFYIERMQPDWVSKNRKQHRLSVLMAGLVSVLLFGLSSVLLFGLAGLLFGSQQQYSTVDAIAICEGPWSFSIIGPATSVEQSLKQPGQHDDWPLQLRVSRTNVEQSLKQQHMKDMSTPSPESDKWVCIPQGPPTVSISYGPKGTVQGGLTFALLFGLLSALIGAAINLRKRSIQPVEVVKWQWAGRWRRLLMGLLIGLSLGLLIRELFGLLTLLIGVLLEIQSFSPQSFEQAVNSTSHQYIAETLLGLKDILLFGGMGLLLGGLVSRISSELMDEHIHQTPNEGILRSARYAAISGLIIMLVGGGCIGLSIGPIEGLFFGLIVGMITGLSNGGIACIQHLLLRVRLWYERVIPWNYSLFLDYATERILLRKVGGGYIFMHRLLLDYFASLETSALQEASMVSTSLQKQDEKEEPF